MIFHWLRKLYNWTLKWADSKYAVVALIIIAFAESSFFPVPPDILLVAMAVANAKKSFLYATYTSVFSVLGGIAGFFIGYALMDLIGWPIIKFYNAEEFFNIVFKKYEENVFLAVFTAAFTPIPYKVFTITAGAACTKMASSNFLHFFILFLLGSVLGRSGRFFGVSTLIYFFGEKIKTWIDKYFNWLCVGLVVLLIGGFLLIKYVL